jgi:hypothetical protein
MSLILLGATVILVFLMFRIGISANPIFPLLTLPFFFLFGWFYILEAEERVFARGFLKARGISK